MSLRRSLLAGSAWVVFERLGASFLGLLIFLMLARFVGPADFGTIAIVGILIDLTAVAAFSGLSEQLIQRKSWDEQLATTAFWLSVSISCLLTLAAWLAAMLSSNEILYFLAFVVPAMILDSFRLVHEAQLRRQFGFRALATRSIVAKLVSGVVGTALAFAGAGVWALIAVRLLGSTIQTIAVWSLTSWRPSLWFSITEARELAQTGWRLSLSQFVTSVGVLLPDIAAGAVHGASSVGLYRVGARGTNMLRNIVVTPIQQTALSAFSKMSDIGGLRKAYLRTGRACAMAVFPLQLGVAVIAEDFVLVALGSAWNLSAYVMQFLAVSGLFVAYRMLAYPALVAAGQSKLALRTNLANLFVNAIAVIASVKFGIVALAASICAANFIASIIATIIVQNGIGLHWKDNLRNVATPLVAAVGMMVVLMTLKEACHAMSPFMRIVLFASLGSILYVALVWLLDRKLIKQAIDDVAVILRRKPEAKTEPLL